MASVTVTRVGHSMVLRDFDGAVVLTDPWFSERAMYHRGEPLAVEVVDLPQLAGVLVSHGRYDHCDLAAFAADPVKSVPFLVKRGLGKRVRAAGFGNVTELDAWQSASLGAGERDRSTGQAWRARSHLRAARRRVHGLLRRGHAARPGTRRDRTPVPEPRPRAAAGQRPDDSACDQQAGGDERRRGRGPHPRTAPAPWPYRSTTRSPAARSATGSSSNSSAVARCIATPPPTQHRTPRCTSSRPASR